MEHSAGVDAHYAQFVNEWSFSLLQTALLLTRDPVEAEELVQDTLVKLYPGWARVAEADSVTAYVRRSLVNRYLSLRRRSSKAFAPRWLAARDDSAPDIAAAAADREHVRSLLASLPARQRAAVVLRYFHDLSDDQIADVLRCKVGTVRSLISRALVALRSAEERDRTVAEGEMTP